MGSELMFDMISFDVVAAEHLSNQLTILFIVSDSKREHDKIYGISFNLCIFLDINFKFVYISDNHGAHGRIILSIR